MSRDIPLSQGMVAIVDDEDYEWLSRWKWFAHKSRSQWYAVRSDKDCMVRMHRVIINAPDGVIVDHINRTSLDNRKSNLRLSNHRENLFNSIRFKNPITDENPIGDGNTTASLRLRRGKWMLTVNVSHIASRDIAEKMRRHVVEILRQSVDK